MTVASDLERIQVAMRNPGRLVLAPSTTTGSDPLYGGSSLGKVRGAKCRLFVRYEERFDPASGVFVERARKSAEWPRVAAMLERPFDVFVSKVFQKTTQNPVYQTPPETRIEGHLAPAPVAPCESIAFIADDRNGTSVYFRLPVPGLDLPSAIDLVQNRIALLPVILDPKPDSAYLTTPYWQICRWSQVKL